MKRKKKYKRVLSFLLAVIMIISAMGCSSTKRGNGSSGVETNYNPMVVNEIQTNEIKDSFEPIQIRTIENSEIVVNNIDVNEILVNCIEVKKIENLEIEVTTINDEFVYLAYKNFVATYDADFDLKKFLTDVGIGCGCILVCVTLSTVAGPVGTYFGAVITSQYTTSAVVIGTVLDAAVSAYQAYQDGGDASYIIGHMLNGVADGFKWSAMLAPLTGSFDGIKAMHAVTDLRKIPGFESITEKEAREVFEMFGELVDEAGQSVDDLTDDVINNLQKKLEKEVSKDLVKNVISQKRSIMSIARKYNPFNISDEAIRAMQDDFWKQAGVTDETGKSILNGIKNGTINDWDGIFNQISDETLAKTAREFVNKNTYEFLDYFGKDLTTGFLDNCIKKELGEDAEEIIKSSITSNDLYFKLVKAKGSKEIDAIILNGDTMSLLKLRYGSGNIEKLRSVRELCREVQMDNNSISDAKLEEIITGVINGEITTLDEVSSISSQAAKNLTKSREYSAEIIKKVGDRKRLSSFLDDLAKASMEFTEIPPDCIKDIVDNSLSKTGIISKYGDDVYKKLYSGNNFDLCINSLAIQNKLNDSLIRDMTKDALKYKGISDDAIERILNKCSLAEWGIPDEEIDVVCNIASDYYRVMDKNAYVNYVFEVAEKRGEFLKESWEQYKKNNAIINDDFAGSVMNPHTNSNPAYIRDKYGDIYMSRSGFPVFDLFARARIELSDLNGIDDISRANLIHHGTQQNIPGWTWHHLEDGKTLVLIPSDLHEAYRHTGGSALVKSVLTN